MVVWTLAKKEIRLLLRDPRAAVILLGMPLIFILILGLALGEGFGQKPDDRLRVTLVDLDRSYTEPTSGAREAAAWCVASTPVAGAGLELQVVRGLVMARAVSEARFPGEPWSHVVRRDLEETASIRVEVLNSRGEAEDLVARGKRAAVLVFEPRFSERVAHCSFLSQPWTLSVSGASTVAFLGSPLGQGLLLAAAAQLHGQTQPESINPFYRDGVQFSEVGVKLLVDPTQLAAASIIEQVAQVTLLRVILPWMIGQAFEKLGDPGFIDRLAEEVYLPVLGRRVRLKELL
ncbi:MAG TPA: hypothetical protein VKE94_00910, partial [Gemmataceae bacterium]|nr:hypothetical protein [Gemmataceae bacterium]